MIEMLDTPLTTLLHDFGMQVTHIPTTTKDLKLKYVVHVFYKEQLIITSEYSMGVGHIPGYSLFGGRGAHTIHDMEMLGTILSTGKGRITKPHGGTVFKDGPAILPELKDVLYCLVQDGQAIEYLSFEDWAIEYGYDADSRKAEDIYNTCRDIGNTLRIKLGYEMLNELRDAYQNY